MRQRRQIELVETSAQVNLASTRATEFGGGGNGAGNVAARGLEDKVGGVAFDH